MTEKLKQLMHERAESVDFATPDLGAMTRTGDRRRRLRTGLAVVGGMAATAVLAGVVVTTLGGSGSEDRVVASNDPAPSPLTWVVGSTLHTPDTETDLRSDVRAYVRTASGYVFSDREGTVWSWRDGDKAEVGRTDARHPRLVSDDEGDFAGWVELDGQTPVFAVLDQATGEVTRYDEGTSPGMGTLADEGDPAYFAAIDDATAYWRDNRGAVLVDLLTGTVTVVDPDARTGFTLGDLEDGHYTADTDAGTVLHQFGGEETRVLDGVYGSLGSFSQDARYYTSDADEPQVYDVATGDRVDFDLDGRQFATGYEWLGPRTLAMIAADRPRDDAVAELLVCEVPAGSCEAVTELGTFDEVAGTLVLPTGTATGE